MGRVIEVLCFALFSIPAFFVASLFIDVFALKLKWIAVAGNQGISGFCRRLSVFPLPT